MQIHGDLGDCEVDIGNGYGARESTHGNNYGWEIRKGLGMTTNIDFLFNYGG